MLKVVNLSKIYKTKGGVDVKALDNVSVSFPETGMVFLLGKSGSGKSTLLNVCGGLDDPTSGEVIVKGRSSKDFNQSDFDSYRNTFIGFIFQEYNILNEFSVEDNIALALELQGKNKDREAINKLLEDVDLLGYAKRKPNTLSGGQKQRIAIARALVKSPQIIMADEPTGALDSNTGKQVFETLKKLSKTKLVLVVSHDRDFAEQYGDRIIELKDGKIISDVTKTAIENKAISDNVTAVGDILCIKSGAELNENDFQEIKSFLKASKSDVIISNGEKDIKTFKEVSRINVDGQKEVFADTDEGSLPKKEYTSEDSKFIKSKLPIKHAVKIGVSSLKTKPFRLFFTILLCTVAFTLFGLLSTMTFYDSDSTFTQTLIDSDADYIRMEQEFRVYTTNYYEGKAEWESYSYYPAYFTPAQLSSIKQSFSGAFGAIRVGFSLNVQQRSDYWYSDINYLAISNSVSGISLTSGSRYPVSKDEICISSYTANALVECNGYDYEGNLFNVSDISGLLNKKIHFNGRTYTIVGIFESGTLPDKFDVLKNGTEDDNLASELSDTLSDGIHCLAFVSNDSFKEISSNYGYYFPSRNEHYNMSFFVETGKESDGYTAIGKYDYASDLDSNIYYFDGKTSVQGDEAIISMYGFCNIMYNLTDSLIAQYSTVRDEASNNYLLYRDELISFYQSYNEGMGIGENINYWEYYLNGDTSYEAFLPNEGDELYSAWTGLKAKHDAMTNADKEVQKLSNISTKISWLESNNKYDQTTGEHITITNAERLSLISELAVAIKTYDLEMKFKGSAMNTDTWEGISSTAKDYTIVGIYGVNDYVQNWDYVAYITDDNVSSLWNVQKDYLDWYTTYETSYVKPSDGIYSMLFIPYDNSEALTLKLLDIYKNDDYDANDTIIEVNSSLISNLEFADEMVKSMSKIFLWVGIVMAVFAALLLSNFISISISAKKREIGILRAVGARGSDVFKIFFSESFVIASICTLISIVLSIVLCGVLNANIAPALGASIFNFGIISLVLLFAIAGLTAVIATFLPVNNAAKKKPVESIRAL